jgi:transcriptional regulator with XRE-family HTH domain
MTKEIRRDDEIQVLVQELRRIIKRSDFSQRRVEDQAGFSRGYLSQLLSSNLDLKVWHVLAILEVFGISPAEFFERVYPNRKNKSAVDQFVRSSGPMMTDLDHAFGSLYRASIDTFSELGFRLERCERALAELESRGVLASGDKAESR